jgi:serine/threonine protein phosphatase PrpC
MQSKNCPGLAMSRSLGDVAASKLGVIAVPDIFELDIKEKHKILIIASDGIWGVLTNEQVINIAGRYYEKNEADMACEELIRTATIEWKRQSEIIDDITVIVIFFNN